MPPPLFTSSMASSAPICSRMPWRAQGPDSGTTNAIFTSRGFCARARRGASAAAAPARAILIAVRRANGERMVIPVFSLVVGIPLMIALRVRQTEIRAAHPVVGQQGLVRPLEDDMAGLQHVAVVRALQGLGHALLVQEDGQAILPVDL